jgi:hypothetical protein
VRRDGTPAKAPIARPRVNSLKTYPQSHGYDTARAILKDMCADERRVKDRKTGGYKTIRVAPVLKCHPHLRDTSKDNLYSLPGARKPINDERLYGHEMDCADCFVALRKSFGEALEKWTIPSLDEAWQKAARQYDVRPDRVFELERNENLFCLEVDRGSEDEWKQVWPKLQAYKKFQTTVSRRYRLVVLFLCRGYRYDQEDEDRVEKLLPLFQKMSCGTLFSATTLDDFLANPKLASFRTHQKADLDFLSL